ncbi:leucine-rich repeat-containing protein 58-like [Brevipalpus obovatus]|uniref:leucine-rich repeat-containing protein 58-like n=1 Tax=Brevipalpus obovatus TaxID=246614 RepID=UPI003D9F100A
MSDRDFKMDSRSTNGNDGENNLPQERSRTNSQSSSRSGRRSSTSSSELLGLPAILRRATSSQQGSNSTNLDLSSLDIDQTMAEQVLRSVIEGSENDTPKTIVTTMNLSQNYLPSLPPSIKNFSLLTVLDISDNGLETLFPPFRMDCSTPVFPCLTSLIAFNNKLTDESLGKNFGNSFAPNLKVLNLSGNKLTGIPESILELDHLRSLFMGGNQIKFLTKNVIKLSHLQTLCLGGNQLTEIPEEVGSLSKLETLFLCENKLTRLPSSIKRLTKLRSLALHMNQLTTLPPEIVRLTSLTELSLRNNPLVVRFVNDFVHNPPSLLELAGRCIKVNQITCPQDFLPHCLNEYLRTARHCVNPKCKGVYFDCRVEQVKFVDFCGSYRLPLLEYLCSPNCTSTNVRKQISPSDGSADQDNLEMRRDSESRLRRVLLG